MARRSLTDTIGSLAAIWRREATAEDPATPIVARCGHCSWIERGTIEETSAAFRAHLAAEHPEVASGRGRR